MEDIRSILGKRVRELRKKRGLSQEGLGWKADLHFTYIGAVERGERNCSISTLTKIAKGLDVNIIDLFAYLLPHQDVNDLRKDIKTQIDKASPEILKIILQLLNVHLSQ